MQESGSKGPRGSKSLAFGVCTGLTVNGAPVIAQFPVRSNSFNSF